jgi:hypothetical protein
MNVYDDLLNMVRPAVKQGLGRWSYTDGTVVDAYSTGSGTGDVECVVIEKLHEARGALRGLNGNNEDYRDHSKAAG